MARFARAAISPVNGRRGRGTRTFSLYLFSGLGIIRPLPHASLVLHSLTGILLTGLLACTAADERAWEKARQRGTFVEYETFLVRHPTSSFASAARDALWELTEQRNTLEGYDRFVSRHDPSGSRGAEVAEAVWRLMTKEAARENFEAYLERYPSGPFANLAVEQIWHSVRASRDIEATFRFLEAHPVNDFRVSAESLISELWPKATMSKPTCRLTTNLAVDVEWKRVLGATEYRVERSPSPSFATVSVQSWHTTTERFSPRDSAGQPIRSTHGWYRVVAKFRELQTLPSEACSATLLPSKGGTSCQLCGEPSVGHCHLRGIHVCAGHRRFTDVQGKTWMCP